MLSQTDILEFIRTIFTVLIFLGSIALTGIFSVPFLGSAENTHRMLVEDGVLSFILARFIVLASVMLISFSLLYALGWLCKRKTTKVTYIVIFLCSFSISIWITVCLIDDALWSYAPQL